MNVFGNSAFEILITVFLGLVLGSFATALSYRLPRGLPIAGRTRSQCTACHHNLGILDLLPLFSWIFLKGKCRFCQSPICWRYPLIELATLVLCLTFYFLYGLRIETLPVFFLAPVIVSIIDIDMHYKIIPDSLNLSIFLIGVALLSMNTYLAGSPLSFLEDRGGDALGGLMLYGVGSLLLRQGAMAVLKREPMGLGDIKFFAATGFWMGLSADTAAVFLIIAGMAGVILALLWKKCTGEAEFPFGPALVAAFVVILWFCPLTLIAA